MKNKTLAIVAIVMDWRCIKKEKAEKGGVKKTDDVKLDDQESEQSE